MDRRECEAFGRSPKEALRYSLRVSVEAWTAVDPDGKPLAMMGVSSLGLMSSKGSPWFLGTERVFDYAISLLELGPGVIASWLNLFDTMENLVSVENVKAIRLLRRWGATIGSDPSDHGGVSFVSFIFGNV